VIPKPIHYEPFDGNPCLIKISKGWVEAWWNTQDGPDYEGFEWVCLDDTITTELDDAKFWLPLPATPEVQS
jgi:hypothetical protein